MNFKKISAAICAALMFTAAGANAATLEFTIGSQNMYAVMPSGAQTEKTVLETAPYTYNDRTMAPVRVISEKFGAAVEWNAAENSVSIEKDGKNILLFIGSDTALVDGEQVTLDVAAQEHNGRTMVPLRFISETLGMSVEYIVPTEQILITDEKPVMTVNSHNITLSDFRSLRNISSDGRLMGDLEFAKKAIDFFKSCVAYYDTAINMGYFTDSGEIADYLGSHTLYSNNTLAASDVKFADYALGNIWCVNSLSYYVANSVNQTYTAEQLAKIYNDEYICAQHILILTTDLASGTPYDDAKKAEARKRAEEVLSKVNKGENFTELVAQYSEDPGANSNPNGYIFTKGDMVSEFENAVLSLKAGETSGIVESVYGYHIIKRMPLPDFNDTAADKVRQKLCINEYNKQNEAITNSAKCEIYMSAEEIAELIK